MRTTKHFNITDIEAFKVKLLEWSKSFQDVVYLDSNNFKDDYSSYDAVIAVDAFTALKTNTGSALDQLEEYQKTTQDWIFGYLSYDLKNEIEDLNSKNKDGLGFPDLYFFQPKRLFFIKEQQLTCSYLNMVDNEIDKDFETINNQSEKIHTAEVKIKIQSKLSRDTYLEKIEQVLKHIHKGNIYEMNFCQEFYVENHLLNPEKSFSELNKIAQAPFTCFFKHEDIYAIGSSPERFLKKHGDQLISQPIKGTAKRDLDPMKDENLKTQLKANPKEISENVMIVDLVRNDLSKIAQKGSVNVEELCRISSYKQVHQMVSTISAQLRKDVSLAEIFKATFPMGSMTGAPKISSMQIIEDLEATKRGLYSGCIGYITPEMDFDFNVVIRSILHNSGLKYTSLMVGSAITQAAKPDLEYEECLVKAKALIDVLEG